ncbi:MAG TPA: CHAD domain-containing protein [Nocardioidaceae bacterium]|nr:CHAD domain-containing protein [Nocardioidaceae bacterium]
MSREPVPTDPPAQLVAPVATLLEDQVLAVEAALHELRRDPEGMIHDTRIALRKLRSTLSAYAAVLHAEPAKMLRRELTWLAGELGPARDSQMLLARMAETVELSTGTDEARAILAQFRAEETSAFTEVRAALESERCASLIARLDVARLRSLVVPGTTYDGPAGQDLQRLVDDLEAVTGAPDARLHELRKAVKKARYVRGLHDDVDSALKRVQTVLGEHQDSVVARQRLATLPPSALRDALVARESDAGDRSAEALRKAVRKLRKTLRSGA